MIQKCRKLNGFIKKRNDVFCLHFGTKKRVNFCLHYGMEGVDLQIGVGLDWFIHM
jgi:hypothetical protein